MARTKHRPAAAESRKRRKAKPRRKASEARRENNLAIVCGSGWSLLDDFGWARFHFPDACVIAVNGAAARVKARHLFSLHPKDFVDRHWMADQARLFGDGFDVNTAALDNPRQVDPRRVECPFVDNWIRGAMTNGTSSWGAARMARILGYERILLCGVPMGPGPYFNNRMAPAFLVDDILEQYRDAIASDTEFHTGVRSMSGWTLEMFGGPAW